MNDKLLNEGFYRQQKNYIEVNSVRDLYALIQDKKGKSIRKTKCPICKLGYVYRIKNNWTRCKICEKKAKV